MIFGLICSDGEKMPPVFIDSGIRMDSKKYIDILKDYVKPWIESTYGPGAPCHTSKLTQTWLAENLQNFRAKEIWPPRPQPFRFLHLGGSSGQGWCQSP